ncbi:hypothetical protein D3C72_2463550 [compost metagenome]
MGHRLEDQGRIGGGILWLEYLDGREFARIGDHCGEGAKLRQQTGHNVVLGNMGAIKSPREWGLARGYWQIL